MLVLFSHVGWLRGGYVGVDVFFVISGFLITKIILADVQKGDFSFRRFYVRRAWRLMPAFLVTAAISFIPAALMFTPADLKSFAWSALSAVVSGSNVFFWLTSGYFSADALTKPLLHTWSLSVEEQFYLFFPLLMVLAAKRGTKTIIGVLVGLGVLSFALNFAFVNGIPTAGLLPPVGAALADGPNTIYFLSPFRAFEFVIGALLVWVPQSRNGLANGAAFAAGCAAILASSLMFNEATVFPLHYGLLPCLGAAAVIWAGWERAGAVLRVAPVVAIGRWSYSIYLVHWPIIVFWNYYRYGEVSGAETPLLVLLSVALGAALHYGVEQPFRGGTKAIRVRHPAALATALVLVVAPAATAATGDGWSWRVDSDFVGLSNKSKETFDQVKGRLESGFGCRDYCEFGDTNQEQLVLLVGDSHLDHYARALAERDDGIHYRIIQSAQCFLGVEMKHSLKAHYAESCDKVRSEYREALSDPRVVAIVHAQHWARYYDMLGEDGEPVDLRPMGDERYPLLVKDVLANYTEVDVPVILVGLTPFANFDCNLRPGLLDMGCPAVQPDEPEVVARAIESAAGDGVHFFDPAPLVCPQQQCILVSDGEPTYTDGSHLSLYGARLVVPDLVSALKGATHL